MRKQQRDAVAQQIEAYRATGTITDAQMLELQADIAQLDAASRRQMLSRLTRALNAGRSKVVCKSREFVIQVKLKQCGVHRLRRPAHR
jgi:hypothetical protein